jgi:hypothetical protein
MEAWLKNSRTHAEKTVEFIGRPETSSIKCPVCRQPQYHLIRDGKTITRKCLIPSCGHTAPYNGIPGGAPERGSTHHTLSRYMGLDEWEYLAGMTEIYRPCKDLVTDTRRNSPLIRGMERRRS